MYNLCKYAHSEKELDEWRERHEWRQMKRVVAKERHMFSYTESLLDEFYKKDNSVHVVSDTEHAFCFVFFNNFILAIAQLSF